MGCRPINRRMLSTAYVQGSGSPGPFERNTPSGLSASLRRHHRDFASLATELAQNVLLDAVVVGNHVKPRRLILYSDYFIREVRALACFPNVGVLRTHDLGQILTIHLRD